VAVYRCLAAKGWIGTLKHMLNIYNMHTQIAVVNIGVKPAAYI